MKEAIPVSSNGHGNHTSNTCHNYRHCKRKFYFNNICLSVLPIPFAASSIAGSTLLIPVYVFLTIGRSEYIVSAMIAVAFPNTRKRNKESQI